MWGWLLFAALQAPPQSTDQPPIEFLSVRPLVCVEPCTVSATVRIARHPLNRWWYLGIDGPMLLAGTRQLDGEAAPMTQEPVWFRDLPAGEYHVVAIVYRQQRRAEAARATQTVTIIG